jgi:predicted dithiol-disulfide oxidoreductase (DUF899 family)
MKKTAKKKKAPLWNLLDLTPEGRGMTWYLKLRYE